MKGHVDYAVQPSLNPPNKLIGKHSAGEMGVRLVRMILRSSTIK